MTKMFTLLFTATALSAAFGLSAVNALQVNALTTGTCGSTACTFALDGTTNPALILVSGGDDDGEKADGKDHRDHHDDCEEDDEGDEDCTEGNAMPAPAGSVTPPANGLFGKGAPPVAVTN